jgi:hypothetical protein
MKNFEVMQRLETPNCLYEYFPNDLLFEEVVQLLILADLLKNIAVIRILHHYTIQSY